MSQQYLQQKAKAIEMLQKKKQAAALQQSEEVEEEEEQKQPFEQQPQNQQQMQNNMRQMFIIQEENEHDFNNSQLDRARGNMERQQQNDNQIDEEDEEYIIPPDQLHLLGGINNNKQQNIFNLDSFQNQNNGKTQKFYDDAQIFREHQNPSQNFFAQLINQNGQQQNEQQQKQQTFGKITEFGMQIENQNQTNLFVERGQQNDFFSQFQQQQPQPKEQFIGFKLDNINNQKLFASANNSNNTNNNDNSMNFFASLIQQNKSNLQINNPNAKPNTPQDNYLYRDQSKMNKILFQNPQTEPKQTIMHQQQDFRLNLSAASDSYQRQRVIEINQDYFYEPTQMR